MHVDYEYQNYPNSEFLTLKYSFNSYCYNLYVQDLCASFILNLQYLSYLLELQDGIIKIIIVFKPSLLIGGSW